MAAKPVQVKARNERGSLVSLNQIIRIAAGNLGALLENIDGSDFAILLRLHRALTGNTKAAVSSALDQSELVAGEGFEPSTFGL